MSNAIGESRITTAPGFASYISQQNCDGDLWRGLRRVAPRGAASRRWMGSASPETTPGPLIMVTQFVGFLGGWNHLGQLPNFRCIRELNVVLEDTTVFIGANNSGKTSILQAVRIALSRLGGRRGTGFTEHDVHCPGETHDPKTALPVRVLVRLEERESETKDPDMVSALDELVGLNDLGRNLISLRVTCDWNQESKAFEPAWEFLDASSQPLTQKAQRATTLSGFFSYARFSTSTPFGMRLVNSIRAPRFGGLLKSVRIPDAIQTEV